MLFGLLLIYQIKHWICDYPLQSKFMLGKFKKWPEWVVPLTCHAGVHGIATYAVAYCVKPDACVWLAMFDFFAHFTVDRLKASPDLGGKFKALNATEYVAISKQSNDALYEMAKYEEGSKNWLGFNDIVQAANRRFKNNVYFWWLLGLDQMAHHLTHYFIIWQLVR